MKLDEAHPGHRGLLAYFRDGAGREADDEGSGGAPALAPHRSGQEPYLQLGSHPDIVSRVWDALGASLPRSGPGANDARVIVFGTPALVHPEAGVVLALAFGTSYLLHLPAEVAAEAKASGLRTVQQWSDGASTDLAATFGAGWVFGGWKDEEEQWLRAWYAAQ